MRRVEGFADFHSDAQDLSQRQLPFLDSFRERLAFEVFEHFANPERELAKLFELRPKILLASTEVYLRQNADWWYLAPESGQHVFFYSREALQLIAARFGYRFLLSGGFALFIDKAANRGFKPLLAKILLSRVLCRMLRGLLLTMPAPGVWRDHLAEKSKPGNAENKG